MINKIVPKPKSLSENGIIKVLPQFSADEKLLFCKKAFCRMVKKLYDVHLEDGQEGFLLCYKEGLPENAYETDGKTVYASSTEGAGYGLATLLQLIEGFDREDGFSLRNCSIKDYPDKDFRAFCSDLARRFHPFQMLIEYVDLCYINKLKYLQLHFTDDESWTLPFESFPKVATEGRCYTKSEIEYLVEYANEAGVVLIPEFEGIGHSSELIKKYPELFGNDFIEEPSYVDNAMCIGKEGIFENIKAFLTEISKTFKYSEYIHVGCDEARYKKWDNCRRCNEYMKKNGIENSLALYSHFVKKITDMCIELGKTPIVWEGFPKQGSENISRNVIVSEFESFYQLADELIEQGFSVINATWKPLYIVPPKHTKRQWTVIGENFNINKWQHFSENSPIHPDGLEVESTDMVKGGMLCQWECTPAQEKPRVHENLPMASDRFWNEKDFYSAKEFDENSEKIYSLQKKIY